LVIFRLVDIDQQLFFGSESATGVKQPLGLGYISNIKTTELLFRLVSEILRHPKFYLEVGTNIDALVFAKKL